VLFQAHGGEKRHRLIAFAYKEGDLTKLKQHNIPGRLIKTAKSRYLKTLETSS
jgi:hypothetical protein